MNNEEMNNNCEQFEILIDSYVDGEIMPHEKITLEHHLLSCPGCKRYMEDITSLLEKTAYLPKQVPLDKEKKDLFWENIQHRAARVSQNGAPVVNGQMAAQKAGWFTRYRYQVAAISAVFILVVGIVTISRFMKDKTITSTDKISADLTVTSYWKVSNIKGTPVVDDIVIKAIDSIGIGQWITTNDSSSAELVVADIGKVTIEPKSKVKIVKSDKGEHRIQVLYGTIDANIDANPRSFFVDMPSVTAVDLGCAYKLTVDSSGDGLLYVKQGKVNLEAAGRESLVPEGKFCITKKDFGPGTPFRSDASALLKKALMDFDFGNCAGSCVNTILKNAKKTDAVTLVSILPRVENDMKEKVYAKVAGFVPPPRHIPDDSLPWLNNEKLEDWIEKIQIEVQSKIEQSMDQLEANMELMNKDIELNGKDWEEWGKNMQKFGEELGKEMDKGFDKNYKWRKIPPPQADDESDTAVYFDKEELKRNMEEMKQDMEQMKQEFDKEQFKQEMERSKEEMKRAKIEMKRANEELKRSMKELNQNLQFDFDTNTGNMKFKVKTKDENGTEKEEEIEVPIVPDVPEHPEHPEHDENDN